VDLSGNIPQECAAFPYGDMMTCKSGGSSPTGPGLFTGKDRDSQSDLDYFGARYYNSTMGRFMSPDPSGLRYANPRNPQSMNLYSYVLGDPLSKTDPTGTCDVVIGGITQTPNTPGTAAQQKFADSVGAISAFPYAGGSRNEGLGDVEGQSYFGPNEATDVAIQALKAAAQNPGPINVVTFSGGAQALNTALNTVPSLAGRINNITYISPGIGDTPDAEGIALAHGNGRTLVLSGTSLTDAIVDNSAPDASIPRRSSGCKHDADCAFTNNAALLKGRSGSPCSPSTIKTFTRGIGTVSAWPYDEFDFLEWSQAQQVPWVY
jgi:RHS repeat-associated protein